MTLYGFIRSDAAFVLLALLVIAQVALLAFMWGRGRGKREGLREGAERAAGNGVTGRVHARWCDVSYAAGLPGELMAVDCNCGASKE